MIQVYDSPYLGKPTIMHSDDDILYSYTTRCCLGQVNVKALQYLFGHSKPIVHLLAEFLYHIMIKIFGVTKGTIKNHKDELCLIH